MALFYVEKLLRSLSPEERSDFAAELRQSRSPMLFSLYEILAEFEREGKTLYRSKALAFKRLYGRAYSQKEDYLFRHECRALADKLERFLARSAHQREFEQNPYRRKLRLLESLLERRLWEDFKSHYEKSHETALRACEFEIALAMERLYVKYLAQTSVQSAETLQATLAALSQSVSTLEDALALQYAQLAQLHAVTTQYLQHYGMRAADLPAIRSERLASPDNPLAQYFLSKARAFRRLNHIQIDEAKRALEAIMRVENDTPALLYEKMSIIANVGVAHMLNAEYESARDCYAQAIAFCQERGLAIDAGLAFNFISVEMKLECYDAALELLKTHWSRLSQAETTLHRAEVMRVFSLIFLGHLAEAQRCIPKVEPKNSEFLRRYYRYAQIAIHYQAQDYDAALLEAETFAKYLRRHRAKPDTAQDADLVRFYIRFLKTACRAASPKRAASFAPLHQELERLIDARAVPSDTLPVLWLKRQLAKLASD